MSERNRRNCRLVAMALLLLAAAVPALAQLQSGDIYVKVQDEKGQALPGATVTVTGFGAPRVETSNPDGQVRFLGLHPGRYGVKGDLEGFSSVDYPDITVNIGGKAQVVLTLSSSIKETITVTADAPLLDERRVNRGAVISTKDLSNIPTARDPWSLLSQAPGVQVDRINVGGNESGQQSQFVGPGASGRENTFAVDGVIVSDMAAVGGSATYFDFGAYDEVQFTVSSADVTIATAGVTVNQVTKRGTNEIRGNARYLRTDGNLQSAPGRVIDSNGDSIDGNKINSVQEYGADVGGPLWRDHLWGWASYGRSDIKNVAIGGQPDNTLLKDFNTKLNFQAGAADSGVLHYWTNNKLKNGRNAGPDTAPESTLDQTTPSKIWKLEDSVLISQSLTLTGLWSNNKGAFTLTPKGGLDGFIFTDDAGRISGSNFDFKQKATIQQERLDGNYFFNLGGASNELKFGGSYRHQDNVSGTIWPHGSEGTDCNFFGCDPSLTDRRGQPPRPGPDPGSQLPGQRRRRLRLAHHRAAHRRHLRPRPGPQDPAARHLLAVRRAARPDPSRLAHQPDRLQLRLLLLQRPQPQSPARSQRDIDAHLRLRQQHRPQQPVEPGDAERQRPQAEADPHLRMDPRRRPGHRPRFPGHCDRHLPCHREHPGDAGNHHRRERRHPPGDRRRLRGQQPRRCR